MKTMSDVPKLSKKGSAKDLWILTDPTESEFGVGILDFTSSFSVFDWGKMPQAIPDKGEALKRESVYWLKQLEKAGIKTHFIADVGKTELKIKLARILRRVSEKSRNYLLPIEVIFRNKVLPTSSLYKRLSHSERERIPATGDLPEPMVEFSTKFEPVDRYISDEEAGKLAGLDSEELKDVKEIALRVNDIITSEVRKRGLDHVDGKLELIMGPERDLYIADTVGTSDENRFLYAGMDLSKQMLRDYYVKAGWYDDLREIRRKELARERQPEPPLMDEKYLELVNDAYKALCVAITGESWDDAPALDQVVKRYRKLR